MEQSNIDETGIQKNDLMCRRCVEYLVDGLTPQNVLKALPDDEYVNEEDAKKLTLDYIRKVAKYYRENIRKRKRENTENLEAEQKNNERDAQFRTLKSEGKTIAEISQMTSQSIETVLAWSNKNYDAIENIETIRLESLKAKYPIFKTERIALIGEQMCKIREEIAKRDLKDVKTADLYRIFGHFTKIIQDEDPRLRITYDRNW